ncbi:hypothetical protein LRR81_08030 [Metabacillus sp. GX 13764]|uniref:hypothetical protein n=1 Tax=Metabacillus kandeliae TaxID=2900151 RepID=UPI001E3B104D|nr:hypothetical protein [Metabacillus kandeliae]MCD7034179.1 hypothetical protein [Metabacillus kandeliae]
MILEEAPEIIRLFIVFLLSAQCTIAGCLFILGNTLLQYYEDALVSNPKNWFTKSYNAVFYILMGAGFYFYKKVHQYNWIMRRLLFVPWFLLMIISSVIIYFVFKGLLGLMTVH